MTEHRPLEQEYEGQTLSHVIVHDGTGRTLPTVIVVPTVMGVTDLELGFGERLNGLGYHAVVIDLYGRRFAPEERQDAFSAMNQLKSDRAALRDRLLAVVDPIRTRDRVDPARVAVIGYCFGGLCALDIARAGTDVAGVAAFHGLFDPPGLPPQPIKAKVLAMHGWDDPMVPPEAVVALGKELTDGGADWQIHAYGHVGHGFTNPNASQLGINGVEYNAIAARRSWAALEDYLAELFG